MVLGNYNLMNVIKQLLQTCGEAARTCWLLVEVPEEHKMRCFEECSCNESMHIVTRDCHVPERT